MSFFKRHVIVVTSEQHDSIIEASQKAIEIGFSVLGPGCHASGCAELQSIMLLPDGHKEGTDGSREYDQKRERFITWLREVTDVSLIGKKLSLEWFEASYGWDPEIAEIESHAWDAEWYKQLDRSL